MSSNLSTFGKDVLVPTTVLIDTLLDLNTTIYLDTTMGAVTDGSHKITTADRFRGMPIHIYLK